MTTQKQTQEEIDIAVIKRNRRIRKELFNALNRMDELIEEMGATPEEKKQQFKDYTILFAFINKNV